MSNQIEYFQHLVDTCEDANTKWILQMQLEKEQKRIAKIKRERLEAIEKPLSNTEETVSVEEQPKRRGRKPKEE